MRRTRATAKVLKALLGGEWHYGLELMRQTGLKSGTLYPILDRLEESDWVVARWETDEARKGPRRRFYSLTELGVQRARRVLAELGTDFVN